MDIEITVNEQPQIVIQTTPDLPPILQPVNGVTALDQLTDVNVPNPLEGQALIRENGKWVARSFAATDRSYEHVQAVASDVWTINHNLGKFPSVTIVDSANDEVEGNVNHVSNTQLTITFSAAFSGKAFLN